MTSASKKNKVLVIGGTGAGKKYVVEGLLSSAPSSAVTYTSATCEHTNSTCLSLDTKYYTAELDLWLVHTKHFTPLNAVTAHETLNADSDIQAIVLVYDAFSKSSFEVLEPWAGFINGLDNEPSVMLCLACHTQMGPVPEARSQMVIDWCVDQQIEYVPVPFQNTINSPCDEDGEKIGLGRVLEALQATMWSEMQMKDGTPAPTLHHDDDDDDGVDNNNNNNNTATTASETKQDSSDGGRMNEDDELMADRDMDEFMHLMERIKYVRETSADVPDDVRRQRAEDTIMELMQKFGVDDDDKKPLDGGDDHE